MDNFNLDKFVENPYTEIANLVHAKEDELIALDDHYHIPVRSNMKKSVIKKVIIESLYQQSIVEEEAI